MTCFLFQEGAPLSRLLIARSNSDHCSCMSHRSLSMPLTVPTTVVYIQGPGIVRAACRMLVSECQVQLSTVVPHKQLILWLGALGFESHLCHCFG